MPRTLQVRGGGEEGERARRERGGRGLNFTPTAGGTRPTPVSIDHTQYLHRSHRHPHRHPTTADTGGDLSPSSAADRYVDRYVECDAELSAAHRRLVASGT
eukprot:4254843-Prymnesium_polylepis.1